MFTIIYPSLWGKYARTLSQVFETRHSPFKEEGELDPFDGQNTIYIYYEKKSHGVFGSCRLNCLQNSPVADFYKEKIYNPGSYLEVSLITFKMTQGHWLSKNAGAFNRAKKSFFRSLYRTIANLVTSMGFKGVVTLNLEDENSNFLFLRDWPLKKNHFFRMPEFNNPFLISEVPTLPHVREDHFKRAG